MMVAMARNWLASAELLATFWFCAVKRAAEVCNYFPLNLGAGHWSTPFELAYHAKPDLRVLFKLFSLAAVRRERQGDTILGKFDAQSSYIKPSVAGHTPMVFSFTPNQPKLLSPLLTISYYQILLVGHILV
jgi:hypothetical protein